MATRERTFPRSKQRSERQITVSQLDFSQGMFRDVPVWPKNSLVDLQNAIDLGKRIQGRYGTRLWGKYTTSTLQSSLPTYPGFGSGIGYTQLGAVTNGWRMVAQTAGASWATIPVGTWLALGDGTFERVNQVLSPSGVLLLETTKTSGTVSSTNSAYFVGNVNGLYWHATEKKIVMHIDTRIFVSDAYMAGWTQACMSGVNAPTNTISTFDEFNQYVYIFNANGKFKFDVSSAPYVYYQINMPIPAAQISNNGAQGTGTPYGRRYLYCVGRKTVGGLSTTNNTFLDRTGKDVFILKESGSVALRANGGTDYGEYWFASPIDDTVGGGGNRPNGVILQSLSALSSQYDPILSVYYEDTNYYSLWASLDIGENGVADGNNPDEYIWVGDFPSAISYYASQGTPSTPSATVVATQGKFSNADIGNKLWWSDGSNSLITGITSATSVIVSSPSYHVGQACAIGSIDIQVASQAGYTVTALSSVFVSAAYSVGKTLYWSDGTQSTITGFTSVTQVTVADSTARTTLAFCMGSDVGRTICDTNTDDVLRSRIASGLTLQQRLWTNLPSTDDQGLIIPGFMLSYETGGGQVNYGQMSLGKEYLAGMYFPAYQYFIFKAFINKIFNSDKAAFVFCQGSTHAIANTSTNEVLTALGISYTLLTTQYVVDESVGSMDGGSVLELGNGSFFVITNEGDIRIFDGTQYGQRLADTRIAWDLQKMQPQYSVASDSVNGVSLWGTQ